MELIDKPLKYINVGCGAQPINGWINYDYNKFIIFARISILRYFLRHLNFIPEGYKLFMDQVMENNIRFANAGKHIPEEDRSVNVVYSSHMLEHLDKEETHQFLIEIRRILVTGGIIRVVVPDFDKLVNEYSKSNNPEKFINDSCLVGKKPKTILKKIQYLIQGHGWHFNMYNKNTLVDLFKKNRFKEIKIIDPGETRINNTDGLDLYVHVNHSIYLEAIK